jgi:hypothetical protein
MRTLLCIGLFLLAVGLVVGQAPSDWDANYLIFCAKDSSNVWHVASYDVYWQLSRGPSGTNVLTTNSLDQARQALSNSPAPYWTAVGIANGYLGFGQTTNHDPFGWRTLHHPLTDWRLGTNEYVHAVTNWGVDLGDD